MSKIPRFALLLMVVATTPSCLVRHRTVKLPSAHQARPLLTASKDELIQRVHNLFDPIHSFVMRADLSPSVLHPSQGTATDYAAVSAYILFEKPDHIRMLGQDPVLGSTIFDMVSNGQQFRVSIPRKKRFIIGNNNAPETSKNNLENLRPAAMVRSLIILPPDPTAEATVLENDVDHAEYILLIIRKDQNQFVLARNIEFDRYTLQITRQETFDPAGNVRSDTKYSEWTSYGNFSYPSQIDIQRPIENYEVELSVTSLKINAPEVTAEKFVLEQPPDTQLQELK